MTGVAVVMNDLCRLVYRCVISSSCALDFPVTVGSNLCGGVCVCGRGDGGMGSIVVSQRCAIPAVYMFPWPHLFPSLKMF